MERKKVYRSFKYKVDLAWRGGRRGSLSGAGQKDLEVGSPPEFRGEPGLWAPEEMVIGALNTCLMLTFLTLAQRKGIEPVAYESGAEGLLENVDGKYRITEVAVRASVVLKSQADLEAAQEVMKSVKENCFISNSLTARVTYSPELRVGA